ncbi:MAG: hypothetical protein P9M11_04200 [Candidatus Tenebribacter burtonii]|nr:hypothetical protein [Candidatus Tenebribacter burtonii]
MKEIINTIMEETEKVNAITAEYELLKKHIKDPDMNIVKKYIKEKEENGK